MTNIEIEPSWRDVKPSDYYVYIHCKISDGKAFYVGKGRHNRGWLSRNRYRNQYWVNTAKKHGCKIDIAQEGMNEEDAHLLEMWLIAKFRHEGVNLTNLTDGGEGTSGYIHGNSARNKIRQKATGRRHTEQTKEKLVKAWVGRVISEETKERMSFAHKGRVKSKIHQENINKSLAGRKMPVDFGATISNTMIGKSGRDARSYDKKIYTFTHDSGVIFTGMRVDFKALHGVSDASMCRLISGKTKVSGGWRVKIAESI